MRHRNQSKAAALLLLVAALGVGVSACTRAQASGDREGGASEAVKVEPVAGTEQSRVILSPQAAERLGIQTAKVRDVQMAAAKPAAGAGAVGKGSGGVTTRKVIPYAAVLYDEHGDTWTFTNPKPLTFLRQHIKIDYIQGDLAVLADGPSAGTTVVTVGAAELLGAELGVGE